MNEQSTAKISSLLVILGTWALVVLPTLWGLNFTIRNALKIFIVSSSH